MFKILTDYPEPALERAWRDCLAKANLAGHYAAPEYFREPQARSGRRFAILALDGGSGGSPAVAAALTGQEEGRRLICGLPVRPQIAIAETGDPEKALQSLRDGLTTLGERAELITVHTWEKCAVLAGCGFRERRQPGVVLLDLSKGADALFKDFDDRAAIRSAIRAGVEVREAAGEDVAEFFGILAAWCRQKNTPCPPAAFFDQLFQLRSNRRLFLAFHQGKMIAGSVFRFLPGSLVEYSANSSRPEYQRLRPNDLLQWTAIQWACAEGFRYFSMGGTHHFLTKFGGKVVPTYEYRLDKTLLRRHDLRDAAVEFARTGFQRLPASLRSRIRGAVRSG